MSFKDLCNEMMSLTRPLKPFVLYSSFFRFSSSAVKIYAWPCSPAPSQKNVNSSQIQISTSWKKGLKLHKVSAFGRDFKLKTFDMWNETVHTDQCFSNITGLLSPCFLDSHPWSPLQTSSSPSLIWCSLSLPSSSLISWVLKSPCWEGKEWCCSLWESPIQITIKETWFTTSAKEHCPAGS